MPDREVAAMLDCEDGEKDRNSNCRHCQASGESESSHHPHSDQHRAQHQRYWDIQLDQDLLETIASIYPEWFNKDMNDGRLLSPVKQEGGGNGEPHRNGLDKNKESLKVKLMLRRPLNQLVDQGILPSLKSPPAFHEQRQKLERAKMGDILKHKLQKRPDRQELIQQHILEDPCIDSSSVIDKQKQSKKPSRLSDSLDGILSSQRPVDLLHTDELLAQAVRESVLPFKSPCGTPSPKLRSTPLDDDSGGSDGAFSPSPPYDFSEHSQSSLPSLEASEPSSSNHPNQGSPCSGVTSFSMSPPSSVSSPVFPSVVSPAAEHIAEYIVHMHHQHQHQQASTPNKNRKKTKPKTQPKARTIKFHEYRGPPNAPKNSAPSSSVPESSHSELWLQQQQLFLRLQQECLQNHTAPLTNTASPHHHHHNNNNTLQKPSGDQIGQTTQTPNQTQQLFESPNSPQKLLSNFEDLKVTDLRAELKKKGLPVSGSKPQLIKRLRSHVPSSSSSGTPPPPPPPASSPSPMDLLLDGPNHHHHQQQPALCDGVVEMTAEQIRSLLDAMDEGGGVVEGGGGEVSDSSSTSLSNEDIVQLQQIWIEKLQRDLERSRKQLQQCQIPSVPSASANNSSLPKASAAEPTTTTTIPFNKNDVSVAENKAAQRQIIHQILQQKVQQQELQKAQQRQQGTINVSSSTSSSSNPNSTLTALLKSSPLNANPLALDLPKVDLDLNSVSKQVPAFPNQVQDSKRDLLSEDDFATITLQVDSSSPMDNSSHQDDFPGVIPIFVCHTDAKATVLSPPNALSNRSPSLPSFSALVTKPPPSRSNTEPQFQLSKPPPNYNEATRQLKVKQHHLTADGNDGNPRQSKKHKSSIKSQAVDDVLEILINNGELSPSAAQDPITPISISSDHPTPLPLFVSSQANEPFFTKTSLMPQLPQVTSTEVQLAQSLLAPATSSGTKDHQPFFSSKSLAQPKDEDLQMAQSLLTPNSSAGGGCINKKVEVHLPHVFFTKSPKDEDLQMAQSLLTPITSGGCTNKKVEVHLPHAFFSKPSSLKLVPASGAAKELDLQLAQSLMDLTPPSSTGFADPGGAPSSSSLDFDFPLDMTDIDAMELDGLDSGHQTSGLDPTLSGVKPLDFGIGGSGSKSADLASHLMRLTEIGDIQDRINDRGIDNDIIEFLGDFEETSGHSSGNFHNLSSFGINHDSDPLFSSNGLDFFSGDDLDFKPHHDLSFLPWGENAT